MICKQDKMTIVNKVIQKSFFLQNRLLQNDTFYKNARSKFMLDKFKFYLHFSVPFEDHFFSVQRKRKISSNLGWFIQGTFKYYVQSVHFHIFLLQISYLYVKNYCTAESLCGFRVGITMAFSTTCHQIRISVKIIKVSFKMIL